jgi:hypothetical protein
VTEQPVNSTEETNPKRTASRLRSTGGTPRADVETLRGLGSEKIGERLKTYGTPGREDLPMPKLTIEGVGEYEAPQVWCWPSRTKHAWQARSKGIGVERSRYREHREPFSASRGSEVQDVADALSPDTFSSRAKPPEQRKEKRITYGSFCAQGGSVVVLVSQES